LPSPDSDIKLWNDAIEGDQNCFGELFRRHYGLLFQYGTKICRDKQALEDNIQDLFAEIWRKRPAQPVHSVQAYLLQALKFKLYKMYRDNKPTADLDLNEEGWFELGHDTILISENDNNERAKKVFGAFDKLPARQKEIIYLKIYKGLSYEDVGQIMDINYQVVRNLLCQALKTLRKIISVSGYLIIALHNSL
jgi:RNA polymerase sigma factor (sigma-70 family)